MRVTGGAFWLAGGALLAALAAGARPAGAQTTPLLEVDLRAGKTTRIDAPTDAADAELDAALGRALGSSGSSFSTRELERVEQKLVADLKRERPRATLELIVFLYPGRVSAERLKSMSEVNVDIELVIDPCDRAVCRDAVGRQIELVGRAVGRPVLETARYRLVWKSLILKTMTRFHDPESTEVRVPIGDCVAAATQPGGGRAWLDRAQRADTEYEPLVAKAIAREAARRRVSLEGPPRVSRSGGEATAEVKVRGDRSRAQRQVLDALAAEQAGMRTNSATPAATHLEVQLEIDQRGERPRRFRSLGQPVGLWIDGQLGAAALWATYVQEIRKDKGAQTLAFDDAEAQGHGAGAGGGPSDADPAEAVAVLSQNFAPLGACARTEATRNPRFGGVTLVFRWMPSGAAAEVHPKEAPLRGGELARCLAAAMAGIALPHFSGAPREVEYPIRVRSPR